MRNVYGGTKQLVYVFALTLMLNQVDQTIPDHLFKINRSQATQEALAILKSARLGGRHEGQVASWQSDVVQIEDQNRVGRYKGYYLRVQHPAGSVTFDRVTGRLVFMSLHRQSDETNRALTDEECTELALKTVRTIGWTGKLTIDPKFTERQTQFSSDPGLVSFRIVPEASGIPYDPEHSFFVTIDSNTGAVCYLKQGAPLPPPRTNPSISPLEAEGYAFRAMARQRQAKEFYVENSTWLAIVNPPPMNSKIADSYGNEILDGIGIVTYAVSFSIPCSSGYSHRDPWKMWIDVRNGTPVHGIGACLKDLAGDIPPLPSSKIGWPKVSTPITVEGHRGKRTAFGSVVQEQGQIASDSKTVQLRFPDRYFIAKFDASQNLLQVGSLVGRPTGHFAEALRAVTR